jgi:hypothetical protein
LFTLGDFDELTGLQISEGLNLSGNGPGDSKLVNYRCGSYTNLSAKRRAAKTAARIDIPVYGTLNTIFRDFQA